MFDLGTWPDLPGTGGPLQRATEIKRERDAKRNSPEGQAPLTMDMQTPIEAPPVRSCRRERRTANETSALSASSRRAATSGDSLQRATRNPHLNKVSRTNKVDYPIAHPGREARRFFGVDWRDKEVMKSAFVRIGSNDSFLHG